jgi:YHS domain-containing protein
MQPKQNPDPSQVQPGQEIYTACGGRTIFTPGTSSAFYNGKPVYFCLPACKADFESDPNSSCLALSIAHYQD